MPLEICGVLSKLNRHFSMAPTVFNVIFNNIWAQRLPLTYKRNLKHYIIDNDVSMLLPKEAIKLQ